MKPLEYIGTRFFDLIIMQPREHYFTSMTSIAKAIVLLDMKGSSSETHKKHLKTLNFIINNTTKRLMIPLAEAEAIIASKEKEEWGGEFNRRNNKDQIPRRRDGNNMKGIDVYTELKTAMEDVIIIVVDIVKEYAMDYKAGGMDIGWYQSNQ